MTDVMTTKQEITILGLGNILMKDDGFGVHFLRWFEQRWSLPDSVRMVEGGEMDLEMSSLLRENFSVMEKLLIKELKRHSISPVKIHA